jgi:hypothetical protein
MAETQTFGLYKPSTTDGATADPPQATVTATEGDPDSPPPAGEPPKEGADETLDQRLARVEKDLARRDRELYGREREIEAQRSQLTEYQDIKRRAAEDPLSAIRALGADPMLVAERILGGGEKAKPTEGEVALQRRLDALEQQLSQERSHRAQRDELSSIRNVIRESDRYGVLAALSEEGDAVLRDALARAGAHYERNREVPNYGELLTQMEKEYTDRIFSSISKLNKLPSMQSKLIAMLGDKTEPAEKDRVAQTGTNRTLTQATKQEPQVIDRKLSPSEKEELALQYLRKSREET